MPSLHAVHHSVRFTSLPTLTLWLAYPSGKPATVLPILCNTLELDLIIDVLDKIAESHVADLAANRATLESLYSHHDEFQDYRTRELWRVGSHIVFACSLEGVLGRMFDELKAYMRAWLPPADYRTWNRAQRNERRLRNEEMIAVLRIRDMVFAHTAFADTRRNHNDSTRGTSLLYFAGRGVGICKNGIEFGSMPIVGMQRGADGRYKIVERSDSTLKPTKMADLAQQSRAHVAAWHAMFRNAIELLSSLPDDAYRIPEFHVLRVSRTTGR